MSFPSIPLTRAPMDRPTSVGDTMGMRPTPAPFYDSFPSTPDGARGIATDNDSSLSKTNGWITTPVTLAPWEDNQHCEIFDGQLVFSVPLDFKARVTVGRREAARLQMPLLNIRHVNTFLRKGYAAAHRAFQTTNQFGQRPIESDFSLEELSLLSKRPVRTWHSLDFFKDRYRASADDAAIKQMVYLSERLILERFNVFGWVHGQVPVDGRPQQVAIRRAGSIDDVENIWSSDLYCGANLFLILKRVYNKAKDEWRHFAFIPWYGKDEPTLEECAYRDYSGHIEYGCAIRIGSVDRLTHDYTVRPDELPQLLGIEECTLSRVKVGPEPGYVRITAVCPKNRLPWLY